MAISCNQGTLFSGIPIAKTPTDPLADARTFELTSYLSCQALNGAAGPANCVTPSALAAMWLLGRPDPGLQQAKRTTNASNDGIGF